ncbi:aldose 1-epimerase [Kineococcus sp. NUM-3379]
MPGFEIQRGRFGGHGTVEVHNAEEGVHVVVSCLGATLLRWVRGHGDERLDLVDGYLGAAELRAQDGARGAVVAPCTGAGWSRGYGLVRTAEFEVRSCSAGAGAAHLTFAAGATGPRAAWPHEVDVTVDYTVTASGIDVAVTGRNAGTSPAPWRCGWHPWFRLGAPGADELELRVPAASVLPPDTGGGTGADTGGETGGGPAPDLRTSRSLRGVRLDTCYGDLRVDADGRVRTTLRHRAGGRSLTLWQAPGVLRVSTGDTLGRDRRRSVALAPAEAPSAAAPLEPGRSRTFTAGVTATL